jgi:two-component system NarL family sensor kinase
VKIEVKKAAEGCTLAVLDDGKGFDPALLGSKPRGGHVGLTLLHSLADDGGGRLRVISAPGQGSRIELTVP